MTEAGCEAEFAVEKQKIKSIEKVLFGNGVDGLVKKVRTVEDAVIIMQSYDHIKTWILGTAVSVLSVMVGAMSSYIWFSRIGG